MLRTLIISFTCAATAIFAADTYPLDPPHTAALFVADHMGFSKTHGRFNDVSGSISWDAAQPTNSTISVTIKADSIDTGSAKRDEHLRSGDFFSVKEFPTMTFTSKSFADKGNNLYEVTGDFQLRGVSKSITIPVALMKVGKDPWGKDRIGFDTTFTIKRSDFGMNFMPEVIADEITIIFATEGVK